MKTKFKKWIFVVIAVVVVAAGALVAATMLSRISTSTVYELKFLETQEDGETKREVFDKEVFLTADDENSFDVEVSYSASSLLEFTVSSSDTRVATVASVGGSVYRVSYFMEGNATITVVPKEGGNVKDSFNVAVKETVPNEVAILPSDDDPTVKAKNVVSVFADRKEYNFKLSATRSGNEGDVNFNSIFVVDDYNKDIFEAIFIDDENECLVVRAKSAKEDSREYITLQTKHGGEDGITQSSSVICIEVQGNYVYDIQLVVSQTTNFDKANDVYTRSPDSKLKEGERRVSNLYFSERVNSVYARIRVVSTNGDYEDVTKKAICVVDQAAQPELDNNLPLVVPGDYIAIIVHGNMVVRFKYNELEGNLRFTYYQTDNSAYQEFIDTSLYKMRVDEESGMTFYEYVYWDSRYMRDDAITVDGKIIGFINGNPSCGDDPYLPSESEGEEEEEGSDGGQGQEGEQQSSSETVAS